MDWLSESIVSALGNLLTDFWDSIFLYIQKFFESAEEYITWDELNQVVLVISGISVLFVAMLAVKQIINTYILETDGDSDTDPLMILEKVSIVLAINSCYSWILRQLLVYAGHFSERIMDAAGFSVGDASTGDVIKNLMMIWGNQVLGIGIQTVVIALLVIFIVKAAIRTAELCLIQMIFPLYACDLLTVSHERWNSFITTVMVTVFGYILQLFCFRFGIHLLNIMESGDFGLTIIGIAMIWVAIKTPKWLEKFSYSSGLGQTVSGGARTAAFMMPRFIGK